MLGESLLDSGVITPGQLDEALAAQRISGSLLGEVLRSMELVSDEALSRALAREAGTPFVAGPDVRVDPSAAALVPESFARRHLLAPLAFREEVLEILQANPFDVIALDDLSGLVHRPVTSRCATPEVVRDAIDRGYRAGRALRSVPARNISELGLNRRQEVRFLEVLNREQGVILVAGPDGSGKRTTIESARSWLATWGRRVAVLGYIDDAGGARLAADAAEGGALVFGMTRSDGSVNALLDLRAGGVESQQLASALTAVVAQRLIRLTCPACASSVTYPPAALAPVGLDGEAGVVFRRGSGCAECGGTGYRGRTAVFEILVVDDALRRLIATGADGATVTAHAREVRDSTFRNEALTAAVFGRTTIEEVTTLPGHD